MALTGNTALDTKNPNGQTRIDGVIATSAVIYHHALVARNAAGRLEVPVNATTQTFVGLAELINVPNTTAGLTGDGSTVRVETIGDIDVLIPAVTAISAGSVGLACYAVDDQTVTTENTLGPQVGIITEFVATNSVWVRLRAPYMTVAS